MDTDERSSSVAFAIAGPIELTDLPGLYTRVCGLLGRSGATIALCDVAGVEVDALTVEALARLQLVARKHRCQVRLRRASPELRDLIAFMGLADVLPDSPRDALPDVPPDALSG